MNLKRDSEVFGIIKVASLIVFTGLSVLMFSFLLAVGAATLPMVMVLVYLSGVSWHLASVWERSHQDAVNIFENDRSMIEGLQRVRALSGMREDDRLEVFDR